MENTQLGRDGGNKPRQPGCVSLIKGERRGVMESL